jgi:hypothetical protein
MGLEDDEHGGENRKQVIWDSKTCDRAAAKKPLVDVDGRWTATQATRDLDEIGPGAREDDGDREQVTWGVATMR